MTRRNLTTAEAAAVAEVSTRMMRHYARTGRITPVERIGNTMTFSPDDVADLASRIERRNRVLAAAARSDAGHIDLDRALLGVASVALGVIGAISPLIVTVTVAIVAVCAFAAAWLVMHELRESGHLRDPDLDECVSPDSLVVLNAYGPNRLDVELLDHVIVPGRFSQIGTRK